MLAAIAAAREGPVEEGSVGAGTGTQCFGWKGGIGTASRTVPAGGSRYVLGVLVQTNFGGVLTIDGVPVGKLLRRYAFGPSAPGQAGADPADGSCMIVVATDAPLDARDLKRLAARAVFGLARTGSSFSHGSGDYAIAFSTAPGLRTRVGDASPATRTILPSDGGLAAVPGGARGDGGSGLQLALPRDDGDGKRPDGGRDPPGPRP